MKTESPTRRTSGPITKAQINTIMLICSQFGITKAERGELLEDRYGKSSTADLSSDQAGHFIAEYERKGFVIKGGKGYRPTARRAPVPRSGKVVALVNQDELDKITALAGLVLWRADNGLQLFLEKRMGLKEGKVRTSADAYLAIEGLKKMFEGQMKRTHGPGWWRLRFTNAAIMEYIELHCPKEYR
ncbi:phage protein GemA/Gp16 family protein [Geobacter sp. SVR]|uniref:phage protein GemA/Gp16 family protein n=1 Tax=Geobacter sp. SVR TaxID=2495594 RepID=UPI00143F03A5|nr:phage protein GemA/Gp16 family protein [Geobacter sp. SVR]BCS55174.1 hypothetical protein GSVR_34820 [Geobacter sp. SVR]GCF85355.1 hypothetical protein GSbR_19550 [Geobacter sp. SVR]